MFEPCTSNDEPSLLDFDVSVTRSSSNVDGRSGCDDPIPVTFISCDGYENGEALVNEAGARMLDLEFDYEIYTLSNTSYNVTKAVGEFETAILEGIAEEFGLLSCMGSVRTGEVRNGSRDRWLEKESVLGISTDPKDATLNSECISQLDFDVSATCTQVKGYMTAWVSSNALRRRHLSEEKVSATIENFFISGYTSDSVLGVSYLRKNSNEPIISEATAATYDTSHSDQGVKPGVVIFILTVSLAVLASVFIVIYKLRKRATKAFEATEPTTDHATSVEVLQGNCKENEDIVDTDTSSFSTENDAMNALQLQRYSTIDSGRGMRRVETFDDTFYSDDDGRLTPEFDIVDNRSLKSVCSEEGVEVPFSKIFVQN